jgi:hypothetical protein
VRTWMRPVGEVPLRRRMRMMMRPGYLQLLHDRSSHEVDAIMQCIIFIGHRVYTGVVEARAPRAGGAPGAERSPRGTGPWTGRSDERESTVFMGGALA